MPIVTINLKTCVVKKSRRPVLARKAAAESDAVLARDSESREPATQSTTAGRSASHDRSVTPQPAKSAIVTARRRSDVPEITEEERNRRGDAMFQEMKRKIADALAPPKAR